MYGILEILVAFCSRSLFVFAGVCLGMILVESLKRYYLDPIQYALKEYSMSLQNKILLGREKYETIRKSGAVSPQDKALKLEYDYLLAKQNTIRDLNASCIMTLPFVFAPAILLFIYVFYYPMKVPLTYKLQYDQIPVYIYASLIIMFAAFIADYFVSYSLDVRFRFRRRLKYLATLHPNGFVFLDNPEATVRPDLKILPSLRSSDQYGFTIQYYFGITVLVSGIFFTAFFSSIFFVADDNGSEIMSGLGGALIKYLGLLELFLATTFLLAYKVIKSKIIESKIIDQLTNFQYKLEKRTMEEQLQEEIKRTCNAALQERWGHAEFVQRIEQIVNDILAQKFDGVKAKVASDALSSVTNKSADDFNGREMANTILKALGANSNLDVSNLGADDSREKKSQPISPEIFDLLSVAAVDDASKMPVEYLDPQEREKKRRVL